MDYSIELIADYACHTGEGPVWHSEQAVLYWLDIPQGRIFRYDPRSHQSEIFFEGDVVGGMTVQQDGALLLFMAHGRVSLLKEGKLITVVDGIAGEANGRFNDVTATPSGSVFCGTLSFLEQGAGSLYRLDRDRTLQKLIAGVGVANGMGFSPDLTQFYFTDSEPARRIYRYQFNHQDDTFGDEQVFSHLPPESGLPDGLTVDSAGCIWSARWNGGKVIRFTPSGSIDAEIVIPGAKRVSSVTFGGSDYRDMYVTTAGGSDKKENGENAGALFRVRFANLTGQPDFRSRIAIP